MEPRSMGSNLQGDKYTKEQEPSSRRPLMEIEEKIMRDPEVQELYQTH